MKISFPTASEKSNKIDELKIRLILLFSGLSIIPYLTFQDFLVAQRESYDFHLSESLLFKTIWIFFIPFLLLMRRLLYRLNLKPQLFESISNGFQNKGQPLAILDYLGFVLASSIIYILLSAVLSTVISAIYFQSNYSFFKFIAYTFSHDFLLIISLNVIFIFVFSYFNVISDDASSDDKLTIESEIEYLSQIRVHTGKEFIILRTKEICYFSTEKPYINIHLYDKNYLYLDTLYSMEKKLDPASFVRVHKSYLVNLTMVVSFRSRSNGDYDLTLRNGEVIRLSRTYAAAFKTRLG